MKEAVKLHRVCTFSNNDGQSVPKTFTPLHYTCRHFLLPIYVKPYLNQMPLEYKESIAIFD